MGYIGKSAGQPSGDAPLPGRPSLASHLVSDPVRHFLWDVLSGPGRPDAEHEAAAAAAQRHHNDMTTHPQGAGGGAWGSKRSPGGGGGGVDFKGFC